MNNQNEKEFIEKTDSQETEAVPTVTAESDRPPLPRPTLSFSNLDTAFAWMSLLVGFLIARGIPVSRNSLGATLVTIGTLFFSGIYLKLSGNPIRAKNTVFAVIIGIFSAGFFTSANPVLHFCLFFFIAALFAYWVYTASGLNGGKVFCENCGAHFAHSVIVIPTISSGYIFPAFVIRERKTVLGKIAQTIVFIIIGLVCAVIPTAIIVLLLSYDKQFTTLLGNIFNLSVLDVIGYVGDGIFGFFIAIILFAVLFGTKRQHQCNFGEPKKLKPLTANFIPRALICATVTPILAVYVIFFISQWDYYVSAFTNVLPEDLTYAEYARSGFFQLCFVCAINAFMLLLFTILIKSNGKKRDPLKVIYSSLISVFTLVLIATALSKMLLYIDSFGLTRKRVYASWLIILLAFFFVAVLLRQFIKKLPLVPILAVTFAVFFALIAIPDTDTLIANYNVDRYIRGDLETVDVYSLEDYGASAVPALSDLRERLMKNESRNADEETLLNQTVNSLRKLNLELEREDYNIFTFNIPRHRAKIILDGIFPEE